MNNDNPQKSTKTKSDKILFLILISNIVIFLFLGFLVFFVFSNKKAIEDIQKDYVNQELFEKIKVNIPNAIGVTPTELSPNDNPLMAYKKVVYTGVIKREKIPESYALGDFWDMLYFDEKQLVETVAGNEYLNKINLEPSTIKSLDAYLGLNVTVEGRLSTGYAEMPLVLVDKVILNK